MTVTGREPVIGLEVHAQLRTQSKMFCGCRAQYARAAPNSRVCAVCGGMPGALPVINRRAVEGAIRTAIALNCEVPELTKFDRKNYQYPDIPKGYQISQYDMPLGRGGWLDYRLDGLVLRCGIIRVHLEEDTGKSVHLQEDGTAVSLVDYNRSGVPLMEIVTQPVLRSGEEASAFFAALRQMLMYLDVCNGRLEEGSMRADVNVSLRGPDGTPGTKVEIKNLNSFVAVRRALDYEIQRQDAVLTAGGQIVQETRGWLERDDATVQQRTKEYAHDYRYFPEPDLPPLLISRETVEAAGASIPEMPIERSARLCDAYGIPAATADLLTDERDRADFFERAVAAGANPRAAANWITGDLLRLLNEADLSLSDSKVTPEMLAELVELGESGAISGPSAKRVLGVMFRTGEAASAVVDRENLAQVSDATLLERLVDEAMAANDRMVADYRRGKSNAVKALMGAVMKASRGKANPAATEEILRQKLGKGE